jgi:F-type H+-transporting ATPase subunit gamma
LVENIKVLRRRIKTVSSTMQVTRAMEMVSASKLRRAQERLLAGRPYAGKIQALLSRLSEAVSGGGNPLFAQKEQPRKLVVLFSADRGLCGSFNSKLISEAEKFIASLGKDNVDLYLVGKKGNDYFRRRDYSIVEAVTDLSGNLSSERSNEITDRLVGDFMNGTYGEVHLIYARFISTLVSTPTAVKFLPLDADSLCADKPDEEEDNSQTLDYIFEPSREQVLDRLLPAYLRSRIFLTMAESLTSEHSARMVSMSNATKNCKELGYDLTLRCNKARQSLVTTEMLEIVGGAEALK